jgi:hypothetical protein
MFSADNQWYVGQIDTVIRVSRAHSIWLKPVSSVDRDDDGPADFRLPILLPSPDSFPEGTSVVLEYRGAGALNNAAQLANAQNADNLDAYGDIPPGMAQLMFLDGNDWKTAISEIDGAELFQIRFTFINNIVKGVTADLDAVGISFTL